MQSYNVSPRTTHPKHRSIPRGVEDFTMKDTYSLMTAVIDQVSESCGHTWRMLATLRASALREAIGSAAVGLSSTLAVVVLPVG